MIFVEHALEISSSQLYEAALAELRTRRRTYVGTRLNRCPTTICTTRGMACKTDSQELADRPPACPGSAGRKPKADGVADGCGALVAPLRGRVAGGGRVLPAAAKTAFSRQ